MNRTVPPFRAEIVGSFLRPKELLAARAKRASDHISPEELTAAEDRAILALIEKQESLGLQAATDGEYRRTFWHFDFYRNLDGCEVYESGSGIQFKGGTSKAWGLRVNGKIGFTDHPFLRHFRFLKVHTRLVPKMTIPSPSVLHFRGGRKGVSDAIYPDINDFYRDLGHAYSKVIHAFAREGCRYLQLDEVNLAYLCDPEQRENLTQRGDDPERLPLIYADMINTAVEGRPSDMMITMHLCRGNFKSMWISSGGYEPVADILFNRIHVNGYFMEWDTERAGGFEPLRFLPKGKTVVLGLVTSKTGALESKDHLKRRIEEASKYCPLEQLCLSPQCGFASTEEGNVLTHDEQWAKLERIVEVAREVWGS
jgi:5-methyltetrahydropteroyltriglutamate--homocysteine methyltransferase